MPSHAEEISRCSGETMVCTVPSTLEIVSARFTWYDIMAKKENKSTTSSATELAWRLMVSIVLSVLLSTRKQPGRQRVAVTTHRPVC
jgi:hypothetical protein